MQEETLIQVSIIVLTYNHAAYIRQAIDSILMQKVNFNYEILVGDDCSTDGSQEILKEYESKYPQIFRLFLRETNIGPTKNLFQLYQSANGEYIAQLESDDYWSDECKLQKQIDFLNQNEEYIGCSHLCTVVDEDGEAILEKNQNQTDSYWYYSKSEYTLEDCEKGKYPGHFCSMAFRNIFKNSQHDFSILYRAHNFIGDRTIGLLLSISGKVYRIDESMSCYRLVEKKEKGNWQSLARKKNRRYEEYHYLRQLEKYVQKELHQDFQMIDTRKDKLVCAAVVLLNNKSFENLKVVLLMILDSGRILQSMKLAVSAIVQKIYYRKIFGEDKPVKF
ncbi:putative glycosyltransferase EpsE [Desulfosporosinus acididurans]|uniref:Putative glycosyltransferase EpsE n=1 Tax=Desulfosporosinus acididurans TaxID=476652 RepID=A0A0J1FNN4_9FIRM|nr:glycosyltransferase [Desulfosporosinus acididurans]KLU65075.1 putative glycosyltransferase EpsE [Desulfosporosinus acididurans]